MHILVICLPCCEYLLVLPCTYVVYVLILRAIIFLIIGGTNIHNLLHFSLITKLVSITIVKRSFSIHHLYYICNHHIHGSSFWGTSNGKKNLLQYTKVSICFRAYWAWTLAADFIFLRTNQYYYFSSKFLEVKKNN